VSYVGVDWNLVIPLIVGLISTISSGIIALFLAKIQNNTREAKDEARTASVVAGKTAEVAGKTAVDVDRIHVAVNSERTAMMARLESMAGDIRRLSVERAVLEETARAMAATLITEQTRASGVREGRREGQEANTSRDALLLQALHATPPGQERREERRDEPQAVRIVPDDTHPQTVRIAPPDEPLPVEVVEQRMRNLPDTGP
jgi:hypothetical protein